MQSLLVTVLVAGCVFYAAWSLMPRALKRAIAVALLKRPLPQMLAVKLRGVATKTSGCDCTGCDKGSANGSVKQSARGSSSRLPASLQVVTFHRRPNTGNKP